MMNHPGDLPASGRVQHHLLLLILAFLAAGAAHSSRASTAHADCPGPDSQHCGLGQKVFGGDACHGHYTQQMPIPGTWHAHGEWPQQHWSWQKAYTLSTTEGPADNQVIGTHSNVTFKTLAVRDVPLWNPTTHYWDTPASVIYVLRQDLLNGRQAAAAVYALRPSFFVPARGTNPAHHRTHLTAVAYYPGAGHGKRTARHFTVSDSGADFDELDLMFRLRARDACIYAYHIPQHPECRHPVHQWEFLWALENDYGHESNRYNHNGTENYLRFQLGPERIYPVVAAYHGAETVGAGDARVRLHLRSSNNRKYYFSSCNCLDHCKNHLGEPCGCIPDPHLGWRQSLPDNIHEWGDIIVPPIQVAMDVFAPDKWMLPDPDNDPSEAVFDVCYNSVPNTPCQCTAGATQLPWVDPRRQEEQNWCWAAASQSVIKNMKGIEPDQEELVRQGWCSNETECICFPWPSPLWRERPCCGPSTPRSELVFAAGWACAHRAAWMAFGVTERWWGFGPISFYDIAAEIDSGKPVYLIWQWSLALYHALLITGYDECGPTEKVFVYNIEAGSGTVPGRWIDYDLLEQRIAGSWFATFLFE